MWRRIRNALDTDPSVELVEPTPAVPVSHQALDRRHLGPAPLTDAAAHAAAEAAGAGPRRTPCSFPGYRGMDCLDPAFVRGQNGYGAEKDACLRHGVELRNWLRALGGGRITAIGGATEAVRRSPL